MHQVVDKFLAELQAPLHDRSVRLKLSAPARSDLARRGYDPVFGARPLRRLIQNEISDVIATEILFGALKKGGVVQIGLRDGKLTFRFQGTEKSRTSAPSPCA
jgi:ATP-dependent Clp protease ATP-binding subunit ClpA